MTLDYITEDDLKSARSLSGYTFADGEIPRTITAASRVVDKLCGRLRRFYQDDDANQVRVYTPASDCLVMIDDLVEITSLKTDFNGDGTFEVTWSTTDYQLTPFNAAADDRPYETIRRREPTGRNYFPCWQGSVQVTGKFGWPEVPAEVTTATLLLASRYLSRSRDATFGILAIGGPVEGTMMRIARTDPDIPGLLADLSRKQLLA